MPPSVAGASPAAFAAADPPVFIGEYQHVPAILDAIKAELNRELRPGRFVLTGSTRYSSLPIAAQSLTGRFHVVTLWPLSQATLRARAAAKPKVHFVDSGLAGRMLRVTAERLSAVHPQAMTELGHVLETFCVGEVLKQSDWMEAPVRSGHWRTHDGDEVDLVLEREDGAVAAIEVKAGERARETDFRGLRKLRDALGERFLGGVLLHLGRRAHSQGDRLHALPVDRLWQPSAG